MVEGTAGRRRPPLGGLRGRHTAPLYAAQSSVAKPGRLRRRSRACSKAHVAISRCASRPGRTRTVHVADDARLAHRERIGDGLWEEDAAAGAFEMSGPTCVPHGDGCTAMPGGNHARSEESSVPAASVWSSTPRQSSPAVMGAETSPSDATSTPVSVSSSASCGSSGPSSAPAQPASFADSSPEITRGGAARMLARDKY
eukprot:CAMPEP_0202782350 /NCGR_PEP_ID=MMETSP1388-20130828/62477_1 /ASSEMBLY_ACC=CAM_ASM_000864 /TAXON_ID=37098 /ORGANISM="Isochrysis sp, Strain CCMP1244" /LENGTH=198 /DNA_ID=CAMNT_0049451791 /DNA_START=579 /DNA_END=1173 /DNA_ORIENTATION=+